MNQPLAPHPEHQRLEAFGKGVLSDVDFEAISSHVSTCDFCQATLESLPEDSLTRLIKSATHSDVENSDSSVEIIPGYEILAEIGRGGCGVVYRARQTGLNRVVALKRIKAGFRDDPDAMRRFRREAEAVARLTHPNIVQVYEFGRT